MAQMGTATPVFVFGPPHGVIMSPCFITSHLTEGSCRFLSSVVIPSTLHALRSRELTLSPESLHFLANKFKCVPIVDRSPEGCVISAAETSRSTPPTTESTTRFLFFACARFFRSEQVALVSNIAAESFGLMVAYWYSLSQPLVLPCLQIMNLRYLCFMWRTPRQLNWYQKQSAS